MSIKAVAAALGQNPTIHQVATWFAAVLAFRAGPSLFQRLFDLFPYAAIKIRRVPIDWCLTGINGEIEILKAQRKLDQLRAEIGRPTENVQQGELPHRQPAGLIAMQEKTG